MKNNNKSKEGKKDMIRKTKKGLMPDAEDIINSPDDIEIGDDITPVDVEKKNIAENNNSK